MSSNLNGGRSPQRTWSRVAALVILMVVLGIAFWIEAQTPQRVAPPPGQAVAIDKSIPAQQQRKAVIDKLLGDGLLRRIETKSTATVRASLRPAFYMLDESRRLDYAQVIYAYYFDGASVNDVVVFRDSRNGNEVGRYNPYRDRLRMYK